MTNSKLKTESERAHEVLDMLDRWDQRMQGHQNQKRGFARRSYRTRMTLFILGGDTVAGECQEACSADVWSRNLSQGGLCFIYPHQLKTDKVIICLNPDQGGTQWFHAEIVRSRQVHNEFWEYGFRFAGRAEM